MAGSLSLGLFRSNPRAYAMRDDLRGQGYEVEVFQRPRYRDEAWIALSNADREALAWPERTGDLPGYPGMSIEPGECQGDTD